MCIRDSLLTTPRDLATLAAMAVLGTRAPLVYLPPLLLCSLITGTVTGGACILLGHRVPQPLERKS